MGSPHAGYAQQVHPFASCSFDQQEVRPKGGASGHSLVKPTHWLLRRQPPTWTVPKTDGSHAEQIVICNMVFPNTKYLVTERGGALQATRATMSDTLEPNEVVIRLKAVAINPADHKMIDQGHRVAAWPLVPGHDGAGVIEKVGDQVDNFAIGDRVLALFTPGDRSASFQERAVVQERNVAKIPQEWSFEEASTMGTCYLTGIMALGIGLKIPLPFLEGGPTSGVQLSSVLVLGGSSAVGAATIQLLRLALPTCKILATSSSRHHDLLTHHLGANAAIARDSISLVADAKSTTLNNRGVDAIVDAVGAGSLQQDVFQALDPEGPCIYAQVWTGDKEIEAPKNVHSVLFRGRDLPQLPGNQLIMRSLQQLLGEHRYKLPLPARNVGQGLDGISKGLDLVRQGVSGQKLVVSI
ncbi:hypothetical protein N7462_000038 [Penicillium macrosclerotiorum]|uniref:uncharacterized protein n=1 Tax=Penicillium macrosclerotiorum TaxID=303699 RepID=UPI00254743FD|nr:uncharacterized protein N7462_000038 [Penicillium macrosclerotiorum]KAJ5698033.1 hypothetical protein N7462_000038 [Penicillium macrosclerotiorum]